MDFGDEETRTGETVVIDRRRGIFGNIWSMESARGMYEGFLHRRLLQFLGVPGFRWSAGFRWVGVSVSLVQEERSRMSLDDLSFGI